ncbi:MAG: nicotinate (nicotinamide) nucleotide adenylyltransferase [Muribaculaceae bacterium]|jgi:nicotinate-nucleotide adenylyltransferase
MTAGIFGGSFNPVHNGHIALAKAIVERGIVDEVWLSLSPQNPLKDHPEELVDDADRLAMLRLATNGIKGLEVCDIELSLPRPSYTINTLRALSRQYPRNRFRLIIGADNMLVFDRWKDHAEIMRDYNPVVYPRPGYDCPQAITGLPEFPVSSTEIRNLLKGHKPVNKLLPHAVIEYISQRGLYTR